MVRNPLHSVLLLSFLLGHCVDAALPPEARKFLDRLPEKKVTLDLILAKAIQSSDSFRLVLSAVPLIEVPRLQALAPTGVQLNWKLEYKDDKRETQNAFSPSSIHLQRAACPCPS